MSEILSQVRDNFTFLLMCIAIGVLMFGAAKLAERYLPSRRKISSTQRIVIIGMCSAIAMILYILEFPVPFIAPPFYKLDFSEVPVLLCGFFLGPSAGISCLGIKILLKLLIKGTTTAFVGDLANFVVGCALILPTTMVYHMHKSRKSAIIGMILGTITMAVFGSLFNAVYLIPKFSQLYGIPLEAIISMGSVIHSSIDSVYSLAALCVVPLNLVKGAMVSVLTLLLYKYIEKPLFKFNT